MTRPVRYCSVSTLAIVAMLVLVATVFGPIERLIAAIGDFDPSFGIGGVATAPSAPDSIASAVAVQPDGKVVAAGPNGARRMSVMRFNPDGSLDAGFGTGGMVHADLSSEDVSREWPFKILIRPDGRIVVVASFDGFYSAPKLALLQYNPDGSLDASFGSGGLTTHTLSGILVKSADAALQPDGAVLVAGHAYFNGDDYTVFTVHRFAAGGAIDVAFGTGGFVATSISRADQAWAMAFQPDGRFVLAGFTNPDPTAARTEFALARYLPDGTLDPSFGTNGKVIVDPSLGTATESWAYDVLVQPDGRIVAAGYSRVNSVEKGAIIRLTSAGTLDASFSDDGAALYDEAQGSGTVSRGGFYRIALQSNGRLVAVTSYDAFGIRANGTLDPEFHGDGVVRLIRGDPGVDFARTPYDMTVQDDDKVIIGSTAWDPVKPGFMVMRLLSENTPPALTPASISIERGTSGRLTIGTASDTSDPLSNLVVAPVPETVPAGLTFTDLVINQTTGTVSAVVSPSCNAATGTFDVQFAITDGGNVTTAATVPVSVLENAVPTLSIEDVTVDEGHTAGVVAVFTVNASGTSCTPITVNYATSDGSAVAPADYTATSGAATIFPGHSSTSIIVPVIGERVSENDETFFVTLEEPANATLLDAQAVATIRDDEPGLIQFAGTTTFDVVETNEATPPPAVKLQLTRTTGLNAPASITFAVSGSATYFRDYALVGDGFITFAPGQSEAFVDVVILGDLIEEETETATIRITEWTNAVLGSPATAQITIRDDDGAPDDTAAPLVTAAPAIASNAAGWHRAEVSVAVSASDAMSGVKSISYSLSGAQSQPVTVVPGAAVSLPIVAEGITTVTFFAEDVAGNVAAPQTLIVRLDKTAPGVVIASPHGGNYTLNEAAAAAYACTDGLSGVASCTGTTASGAPLDTTSAGSKLFTVVASDQAGNAATVTVAYSVIVPTPAFRLVALFDQLREHNRGSAIPVKLQVEDAAGTNVSSAELVVEAVAVSSGTEIGAAEEEVLDAGQANPLGRFRFVSDAAYLFNLKTTNLEPGSYVLIVRIAGDAAPHAVPFRIRQP